MRVHNTIWTKHNVTRFFAESLWNREGVAFIYTVETYCRRQNVDCRRRARKQKSRKWVRRPCVVNSATFPRPSASPPVSANHPHFQSCAHISTLSQTSVSFLPLHFLGYVMLSKSSSERNDVFLSNRIRNLKWNPVQQGIFEHSRINLISTENLMDSI